MQAKTQTLKMTIVSGLRIIDSNAQTGITWWNWTGRDLSFKKEGRPKKAMPSFFLEVKGCN
ncbi:hypothetical protein BSPWISOXPB_662 [uncultured Gammaproteobacteria bacterium]|nr:hypothetical protein BSPWISOXPB_662 [uncultured Gammaproteobacteria bacterium]